MKKIFTLLLICSVSLLSFADLRQGVLPGEFKVSPTKTVHFSKGNYQCGYNGNRFAEQQYYYIGAGNNRIASWYTSTSSYFDLLGWGKDYRTITTEISYYSEPFNDWGNNYISKADHDAGWRTMTDAEWRYLLLESGCHIAFATIDKTKGIVLLPEDKLSEVEALEIPFKTVKDEGKTCSVNDYSLSSSKTYYTDNQYTPEEWEQLEKVGAVFLPAACYRTGSSSDATTAETVLYDYDGSGYYWSSTPNASDSRYASYVKFVVSYGTATIKVINEGRQRYTGMTVRLVTENPTYNPVTQLEPIEAEADKETAITFTYGGPSSSAVLLSLQAEDSYDDQKQCVVLRTTLDDANVAQLMDNLLQNVSDDFGSVFSGVSFFLPAGKGDVKLDIQTHGLQLSVHIGNSGVAHLTQNERGEAVVHYDIQEPTLVCIHASVPAAGTPARNSIRKQAKEDEQGVELYAINILPSEILTGVDNVQGDNALCTKVLRDGKIFILRDGKTYTIQGQEVK